MATTGLSEVLFATLPNDFPAAGTGVHWQKFQAQTPVSNPPSKPKPKPKPTPDVPCRWPDCQQWFARKQELERHTLSCHFPYPICCPHPSCPWRGTRKDELAKHMKKGCGKTVKMDSRLYKIFDAKWLFEYMYGDSADARTNFNSEVVLTYVVDLVQERGIELKKTKLWGDPWGRQTKGRRG